MQIYKPRVTRGKTRDIFGHFFVKILKNFYKIFQKISKIFKNFEKNQKFRKFFINFGPPVIKCRKPISRKR